MNDKDAGSLHKIVSTAGALTGMAILIYNAVPGTPTLAGYVLIVVVSFIVTVLLERMVAHQVQIVNTVLGWFGKHSQLVIGLLVTLVTCYAAYRLTESLLISLLILLQNAVLLWLARNYVQRLTPTAPHRSPILLVASQKGAGSFSDNESFDQPTEALECKPSQYWVPLKGSKWIWMKEQPEPDEVLDTQVVWYKNSFAISDKEHPKHLEKCDLTIAVDNEAEILLNGTSVGKYHGHDKPTVVNIKRYLKPGRNELRMRISNWGNPESTPESNPAGVSYTITAYPKD